MSSNFDLRLERIEVTWAVDELQDVLYFGDFPKLTVAPASSSYGHAVDEDATRRAHLESLKSSLIDGSLTPDWLDEMRKKLEMSDSPEERLLERIAEHWTGEDTKRFDAWQRGDWNYESCTVKAIVSHDGPFGRVTTDKFIAVLGGIDPGEGSAGDSYRDEVEREQLGELKAELEEAGVPLNQWDVLVGSRSRS